MPDDLTDEIAAAAQRPQSTSVDGEALTERSIADQIAADRYLRAQEAARLNHGGLRFSKIVPPGAT